MEYKRLVNIIKVIAAACITGIITGAIAAFFGRILLAITNFRYDHSMFLIPFLGLAGYIIIKSYQKWGGESIKGMVLVFEAGHGIDREIPLIMIPLVMVGTWMTHLFGGSAGREGVSVQIGGTIGHRIGLFFNDKEIAKIMLVAGMAAGFSGLFRTPMAAVFFALEVLVAGELRYKALIPTILASLCAYITSALCGLEKFTVNLTDVIEYSPENFIKLLLIGLAFGVAGRLFSTLLHKLKDTLSNKIPDAAKRAVIFGIGISIVSLLLYSGRYSGLGVNLISYSFNGGTIHAYDWILKLLLTVITLAAGYQGGEVTPLFAIGASLGVFLAGIFGLPVMLIAALGYAAVFSSATNTLLAPVFIGVEVFGYEYLPIFFLVCAVSYSCNGNKTIYPKQKLLAM
ncbi:chloride channel protein [Clostridium sp. DL1XJH146]